MWTITLEEDGDDLILPLPPELLAQMGWQEGDTLVWDVRDDGSITLSKSDHITRRQFLSIKPILTEVGVGIAKENLK